MKQRSCGSMAAIHSLLPVMFAFAQLLSRSASGSEIEFGAYYTELKSGQDWEVYSRTGQYADVVVNVAKAGGSLVFWRGNSYLPYWKTARGQWSLAEIISRVGNGIEPMSDRCNVYSHVEVIENSPARMIVRWRYLPSFTAGNPHGNVKVDNFVDETFVMTRDGRVNRVVKHAAKKIDDWNDPLNQTEEELQLDEGGIIEVSRKGPAHSMRTDKAAGKPEQKMTVVDPASGSSSTKVWEPKRPRA